MRLEKYVFQKKSKYYLKVIVYIYIWTEHIEGDFLIAVCLLAFVHVYGSKVKTMVIHALAFIVLIMVPHNLFIIFSHVSKRKTDNTCAIVETPCETNRLVADIEDNAV